MVLLFYVQFPHKLAIKTNVCWCSSARGFLNLFFTCQITLHLWWSVSKILKILKFPNNYEISTWHDVDFAHRAEFKEFPRRGLGLKFLPSWLPKHSLSYRSSFHRVHWFKLFPVLAIFCHLVCMVNAPEKNWTHCPGDMLRCIYEACYKKKGIEAAYFRFNVINIFV